MMAELKALKEIPGKAKKIETEITEIRRKLHANPEVMFQEKDTCALIRSYLSKLDVEILDPYTGTDTVCLIRGSKPGKTVLLRADIDALSITETGMRSWISERPGSAHSCGHDGHTAMLLGAVSILSKMKDSLHGNVKAVFQPAEEDGGGGKILVEKGVLDHEPAVDEVYALHGWPGLAEGFFESVPGEMMAAVDNFTIKVKGKGAHAAMPHLSADPVIASAQIIISLQSVISRNLDPVDSGVISICSVNGGELNNVIPDTVLMKGTARYFRKETGRLIKKRIREITEGVCNACGTNHTLDYRHGYIPLVNNPEKVAYAGRIAQSLFGEDSWSDRAPLTGGGEDFSFYLHKKPGAFIRLGLGKSSPPLHSSSFDFNDKVLARGTAMLCALASGALYQ